MVAARGDSRYACLWKALRTAALPLLAVLANSPPAMGPPSMRAA